MSRNRPLFPHPSPEARNLLEDFGKVLDRVVPLKAKHRKTLPYGVRDLSRLLTEQRGDLPKDYMGDPKFLSAYLRYFLPWNLYRMTRLLSGLDLGLPDGAAVADLGAGPLTFALALWVARPDLRDKNLTITCLDRTPKPMRIGLDLFKAMTPKSGWRVHTVKGTLGQLKGKSPDLLVMANTLNELGWADRDNAEAQADRLAMDLERSLAPAGSVLLMEPGVRRSGNILSTVRRSCLDLGLVPMAPCPHASDCPMPGRSDLPWCHFRLEVFDAPQWLHKLSAEAKLPKKTVSLSFLHLARGPEMDTGMLRAVSEPFPVNLGHGQYCCSGRGLTLRTVTDPRQALPPGTLAPADWPDEPARDDKSGALILPAHSKGPERS